MEQVLEVANSTPLWMFALTVTAIVVFQAIMFIRLASKTRASVEMTNTDVKAAVRTGAISSLGPSVAIVFVVLSLMTLIGDPVTLMRVGIIGNAPIETVGASLGSEAAGADLGSENYTLQAFTSAVWVMCLGGSGWLIFTALFTKSLGKVQNKAASKKNGISTLKAVSTAAIIGAFGYLGTQEMVQGIHESIVLLVAFILMPIILRTSDKFKWTWLREWSLGLVIVAGVLVGYFLS